MRRNVSNSILSFTVLGMLTARDLRAQDAHVSVSRADSIQVERIGLGETFRKDLVRLAEHQNHFPKVQLNTSVLTQVERQEWSRLIEATPRLLALPDAEYRLATSLTFVSTTQATLRIAVRGPAGAKCPEALYTIVVLRVGGNWRLNTLTSRFVGACDNEP